MNSAEYSQLVLEARDYLFGKIREQLPAECEMEKRFIQSGVVSINEWAASLVNKETDKVRIFVMTLSNLTSADLPRTAGAKNFKPEVKILFELFHDHLQGTDAENSQKEFESDALCLQFAIESNRSLPPKGNIENYTFSLGILPSSRSLHYARGEMTINFREIRH
jgi:hypothetical protein